MAKTKKRGPAVDFYCNCSWRGNRAETISSTELKRIGGVDSRGFRDESLEFDKCPVCPQDSAVPFLSTKHCCKRVTCVNAESSGQAPGENREEKEMKEQAESQVVKSLQGPTKPRRDSEAKGIHGGFSARMCSGNTGW